MKITELTKTHVCCEKDHKQFDDKLLKLILAFEECGLKFMNTGNLKMLGHMMVISDRIRKHKEWNALREEMLSNDFLQQVAVLEFLADGFDSQKVSVECDDIELCSLDNE